MGQESSETKPIIPRPEIENPLSTYLDEGERLVHIAGEPGVGKSTALSHIENEYTPGYGVAITTIGEHHSIQDLYREVYSAIFARLPDELKEESRKLSGGSGSAFGFGGGLSFESDSPKAPNLQIGYRDVLSKVSDLFPDEQRLIICVDDVHKLSKGQATQDAIKEAASYLDSNITLVTAGRLTFDELSTSISVTMFSEAQTVSLLIESFPDITEERARQIHKQLSGHPLHVGLLIESDDTRAIPDIPQGEIYDEIESRYLRSLSDDEERFLIATSPLLELDERRCKTVIADRYGFDQVDISRILRSLRERVIVQELGRNADGFRLYKIHDVFRDFLIQRLADKEEDGIHQRAFRYYAEKSLNAANTEEFEREVDYVIHCIRHISENAVRSADSDLVDFLSDVLDEDRFRFYSISLVADELKTWQTDEMADQLTDTVITQLESQPDMARHFLDEDTDRSWAEELFRREVFDEPEGPFLRYLRRVVSMYPDFVLKVIESTTTDEEGPRRLLLSISSDLPPEMAASISGRAANWIKEADSGRALNHQGHNLVNYLCENGRFDAGLEIMDAILQPREAGTGDSSEQDRAASIYAITETLDETFDDFVTETGRDFIDMLKSNLSLALQDEDEDGNIRYKSVARRRALENLNYSSGSRGELEEVLLDHFVQATEQWMVPDPKATDRQGLLDRLLDGPETLRRVGLYLLGNHSDVYLDRVKTELTAEDNFQNKRGKFEFYRLLQNAFENLDRETQQEICELISVGPYTEDVRNRAEHRAQQSDETAETIARGIRKRWRRDRLYLLRGNLPDEYRGLLDDLIDEYGKPETLPTEQYRPETTGGHIKQRGPEETEELADRSVRDVLTRCVEWEPPETETWKEDDEGQLEEFNHLGFSRQLRELIKENPAQYAEEIAVLQEANSQYAEAAFRALQEVLKDDRAFSWDSIIELCQIITDDPEEWSSGCRTNIAQLLNKGTVSDETAFPEGYSSQVQEVLLSLIVDSDPNTERDQPPEGHAGHGNPMQVAINSVRPMALGALVSFATWSTNMEEESELDQELHDAIRDRIVEDPSLAVNAIVGREFYHLWNLDQKLVEDHLDYIFPREDDPTQRKLFLVAWDQYVRHNNLWAIDALEPYYQHALEQLDMDPVDGYQMESRPTAAHIASSYIYGDEELLDDESLISQFYSLVSPEIASDLAASISSTAQNDGELDSYWDKIKSLWEWRLDAVASGSDEYESEFGQFLSCTRYVDTARLPDEKELIVRSFEYIADNRMIWRRIEEWLAEESVRYPETSTQLYQTLVETVPVDEWAMTAMDSQEDQRQTIYQNAVSSSDNARQMALTVANRFAAEHHEMDREFLGDHFGSNL